MTDSVETARAPKHICFVGYSIPISREPIDSPYAEVGLFLPVSVGAEGACLQEHEIQPFARKPYLVQVSMLQ